MSEKYIVLGREFDNYIDAENFKNEVEDLIVKVAALKLPYLFNSIKAPVPIQLIDSDLKHAPQVLPRSQWG